MVGFVEGILRTVKLILHFWRSDLKGQFPFSPDWDPNRGPKVVDITPNQLSFFKGLGKRLNGKGIDSPQLSLRMMSLHAFQKRQNHSTNCSRIGKIMTGITALLGNCSFRMGNRFLWNGSQCLPCRNLHLHQNMAQHALAPMIKPTHPRCLLARLYLLIGILGCWGAESAGNSKSLYSTVVP